MTKQELKKLIEAYEKPRRKALSSRFPLLKKPILFLRIWHKKIYDILTFDIASQKSNVFFTTIVARHQSVLLRKLGDSDQKLQKGKIVNLKRACEDLNGLIIQPQQIFSLWNTLGNPTFSRGYVDGMLLSNGQLLSGVGGGLCQMSNFLCWLFLHADTEVGERYHHSRDVFPDSGRTLPFGSGATCLYNFVDLKIRNTGNEPLQLKIWVTDTHLKGQLLSPVKRESAFSLQERDHLFIQRGAKYFRYNTIWRVAKKSGKKVSEEKIFENFAQVLYEIPDGYFEKNNFTLVDLDDTCDRPI